MGEDKASVLLAGKPLIEHVLERIENLGDEILITTNQPQTFAHLGHRMAGDRSPGGGALFGLQTALTHARGEHVLVVGTDMPFLSRPLLERLLELAPQAEIIVPQIDGFYEPLHAVYQRSSLTAVNQTLAAGERKMISLFQRLSVLAVGEIDIRRHDPQGLSFFNVNTPADLRRAEEIYQKMSQLRA